MYMRAYMRAYMHFWLACTYVLATRAVVVGGLTILFLVTMCVCLSVAVYTVYILAANKDCLVSGYVK